MSIVNRSLLIGLLLGMTLGATTVYLGAYVPLSGSLESRLATLETQFTSLSAATDAPGLTVTTDIIPTLPSTRNIGYMKIEGIPGEASDEGHKEWIEIVSIKYVMTPIIELNTEDYGAFVISKMMDKASPKLAEALYSGKHIDEVTIDWVKDETTFMTYCLEDVRITVIQSADTGTPIEEVSFNYSKISWTYHSPGEIVAAGWDLEMNRSMG